MNIGLMPTDVNVEFVFVPPEIYKSDEEIKQIYFNLEGTIVLLLTKGNNLKVFDYLGKIVIFTITFFKEMTRKIINVSWAEDSSSIYVTYEKGTVTGYQRIVFNFNSTDMPFTIDEIDCDLINKSESNTFSIRNARVYYSANTKVSYLYISGSYPYIITLKQDQTKEIPMTNDNDDDNRMLIDKEPDDTPLFILNKKVLELDETNDLESNANYTILIKETAFVNSFYLIIKELYMIIYIKPSTSSKPLQNHYNSYYQSTFDKKQSSFLNYLKTNLNTYFTINDVFSLNVNGEIISCQLNEIKTLMLINSTDRVLRLFRIVEESITLLKDYSDSVNKKRWLNCSFYTNKIKSGLQDLIITSLCDSNSLEFSFIDIETGKITKKLEPFKYSAQDFICHYKNHFTLLIISNKKLFAITGFMVNHWGCFAPGLKYIEDNVDFIEDEGFFDSFENKMKNNIQGNSNEGKDITKNFRKKKERLSEKTNLFFKYSPKDNDPLTIQSQNDLKELFAYTNETIID